MLRHGKDQESAEEASNSASTRTWPLRGFFGCCGIALFSPSSPASSCREPSITTFLCRQNMCHFNSKPLLICPKKFKTVSIIRHVSKALTIEGTKRNKKGCCTHHIHGIMLHLLPMSKGKRRRQLEEEQSANKSTAAA